MRTSFVVLILPAFMLQADAQTQPKPAKKVPIEIAGISVTPHVRAESMRYAVEPGKATGALVRLFVKNTAVAGYSVSANEVLFDGRYPIRLQMDGKWAWHDTPNLWNEKDRAIPPGAVSVWTFNGMGKPYSVGGSFALGIEDWMHDSRTALPVRINTPAVFISFVTFLSSDGDVHPDTLIFHLGNNGRGTIMLRRARLYLPPDTNHYRYFLPISPLVGKELACTFEKISRQDLLRSGERNSVQAFPETAEIAAKDKGGAKITTGRLPLTYAVLEVEAADAKNKPFSVWARVRIKRETFDISGGWINDTAPDGTQLLSKEPYLKTLKRMHIDTGHIGMTPGYSDNSALYSKYPIKFFGAWDNLSDYTVPDNLPRVHAVEALGEPQLGFSKDQRLPQEVWKALDKYGSSPFATTLTLNDESSWRYYAGLSDFPHHDNYRVTAPSADLWQKYRWRDGTQIGWGSPLETIGDLCRCLRDMSRPAPTAYWSQGASAGWDMYDGRRRTSPTPDELRMQAYHALASRITSLYWFNPSLKGIVKFRDLIEPITRVGREMRALEAFYLTGDVCSFRRLLKPDKSPDWELSVIAAPQGALLFALDCDYQPDPKEKIFVFGTPRPATFHFDLPAYLRPVRSVFRIDADGVYEVKWKATNKGVEIEDTTNKAAIYVAATDSGETKVQIAKRLLELKAEEQNSGFDPANNDADFAILRSLGR